MTRSSWRTLALWTVLAAGLAMAFGACTTSQPRTTFPPIGSTPEPAGEATAAARREVVAALAQLNLQVADSIRTYRPPEGPLVAAAPRSVVQVALPNDLDHGFIVLYAFDSPAAAAAAAKDHAAYVGSNVGRSQFPFGTRFVIRVVGSTVVFFHWSPEVSTDELTPLIEQGLLRIGSGVPVEG